MQHHRIISVFAIGLFLLSTPQSASSQPEVQWTRTFGGSGSDGGASIRQTDDGGYIITGRTDSFGAGGGDVWLIKTDSSGEEQWSRTFGGNNNDGGHAVQQTADGGYITTGFTWSFGVGDADLWLIKTDTSGNEKWSRTYGGTDHDDGHAVQQTTDGGYIILAWTRSFGAGLFDIWLVKTDSSGTEMWNRTFGGGLHELGYSVQQTSDDGYIITGYTESFGAGSSDIWLIKTDSSGSEEWSRTFGGINSDSGQFVRETHDAGYIIAGYTRSSGAGSSDFWLIKTDSSGTKIWDRTFGGNMTEMAFSASTTDDKGCIVTGLTESFGAGSSDVWLVKVDSSGNEEWSKTIGGSSRDRGESIQQTTDGGYIIAAWTESFGAGGADLWLIKVDSNTVVPTRLGECNSIPARYALHQNHPNPFNPVTTLRYDLPEQAEITLSVHDLLGREVVRLVDGSRQPGYHRVVWNGRSAAGAEVPSGIYIVRLVTPGYIRTIKTVLLK